jgi:hypothetical protein
VRMRGENGVAVGLDDFVKLADERGGFFVG